MDSAEEDFGDFRDEAEDAESEKDDLGALEIYIEEHPNDHAQRWRLAKKLYMAWEYKRALEHLLVVKKEWRPKLNVRRYLAATHYRLGHYPEAIEELTGAIATWPDEVGLHEQLARMYEVSGKVDLAIAEWTKIAALKPGHSAAEKALARLRSHGKGAAEASGGEASLDMDLTSRTVCSHCGAPNSVDFDRCWNCHAALVRPGTPTPVVVRENEEKGSAAWLGTLALGIATVAFVSGGVYVTFREFAHVSDGPLLAPLSLTVDALLRRELLVPRLAFAGILFVGWILAFGAGFKVARAPMAPFGKLSGAALLLTSLTYLIAWAPVTLLLVLLPAPFLAAAGVIATSFGVDWIRGIGIWAVQSAMIAAIAIASVIAYAGPAPITEYMAISRYAASREASLPAGVHAGPSQQKTPWEVEVSWQSTGSRWLDTLASRVTIEIVSDPVTDSSMAKLLRGRDSLRTELIKGTPYFFMLEVEPGQAYVLEAKSKPETTMSVRALGVLAPVFGVPRPAGLADADLESPARGAGR